jgi:hypothetical protein
VAMARWWISAIAVFTLVGCAGQTLVYNTQLSPSYRPTEFGYGAGQRDLTTVVHGDPFPGSEQQFQAAFVALLNRHQPILQATHFTLTPGDSARPIYRAVYLLDYAHAIPDHICHKRLDIEPVDLGSTVRVTAAFCWRESYLSTVTGEVEADGIDDPKFESLIGQINLLLFPPIDPTRNDRRRWLPIGAQEPGVLDRAALTLASVAGG